MKPEKFFTRKQLDGLSHDAALRLLDEVIDAGPGAIERFDQTLGNKGSVRFAHMCALRKPPGTRGTERSFMEGQMAGSWLDRLGPRWRRQVLRQAQQAGISISGKVWKPSLGKASDPRAWVSDMHDVKAACLARGLECEGAVTVKQPEAPPPKPVKLAPAVVGELIEEKLTRDTDLAARYRESPKVRRRLREEIIHKHGNPRVSE